MSGERVGIVVIGRNEGERLQVCLRSLVGGGRRLVYVDSGSTDDSVAFAASLGVQVVELDTRRPFTAAYARDSGFQALMEEAPHIRYVQFVDGDCEVVAGWLPRAIGELDERPEWAVVAGRRRERYPERSMYNRLCDLEWDTPIGISDACGGDAMMRVEAFGQVDGFDASMIAGEEPELCVRLRKKGWLIARIDAEMTLHDAAMTRFSHWWRRTKRAGHAFAEGRAKHGEAPWRHNVRETRSALFWGLVPLGLAVAAVGLAFWRPLASLGIGLWPAMWSLLFLRVYRYRLRRGAGPEIARLYALFVVLAKLPELAGICSYWYNRLRGKRRGLIEYK